MSKKLTFFMFLFVGLIYSCQKKEFIDSNTKEYNSIVFFKNSNSAKPYVIRLANELQLLNSKNEFVTKVIENVGFPRWDKAYYLKDKILRGRQVESINDSTIIIPIVNLTNQFVTGAIIVNVTDTISFNLVRLIDYQNFGLTKKKLILNMLNLDYKVYGYTKFKVLDSITLSGGKEIFLGKNDKHRVESDSDEEDACDLFEMMYDPDGDDDPCDCDGDEYGLGVYVYRNEEECLSRDRETISFLDPNTAGGGSNPNTFYSFPNLIGLGGGLTGGGTVIFPYVPIPTTIEQKTDYLVNELNINQSQKFYLLITRGAIEDIYNFISDNNNIENRNVAKFALDYIGQNPDVPFETISNWFFKLPEYRGGEPAIDENLITYDQPVNLGALPSLSSFTTGFPKLGSSGSYYQMPPQQVYQLIGGPILNSYQTHTSQYGNACAVRGSRGLNYSNPPIIIPVLNYSGSQRTEKGGDNKNYILDAVSLNRYMKDKFGETTNKLEGADANDPVKVAALLKGKNGIYVIVNNDPSSVGAGYSGHTDLILNGKCVGGAYTTPKGGVKSIRIWILN